MGVPLIYLDWVLGMPINAISFKPMRPVDIVI